MNTEINMNEKFGITMYNTILEYNLKNILEIGSCSCVGTMRPGAFLIRNSWGTSWGLGKDVSS